MIDSSPDPDSELPDDEDASASSPEESLPEGVPSQPDASNADAAFTDDAEADFAAAFHRLSEQGGDAEATADSEGEAEWPAEDLESAYRRALEANDAVEWDFSHYAAEAAGEGEELNDTPDGEVEAITGDAVDAAESDSQDGADESGSETAADSSEKPPQRIRMSQVVEAALFVGGEPLTSKRLCYMLKGDYDLDAIELAIDELNRKYIDEDRPYEIRLGEGGYRIVLRDEFNSVRNRVFGIGPREVKLSQDVLEVLALVAYRQPVTQNEIEELGKTKPSGALRQLLRRQIIELHRDDENRKRVTYTTTPRFLSVFGIGSIDELPQADELAFK